MVGRLDLEPGGSSASGLVGGVDCFDHDLFVPVSAGFGERLLRHRDVVGDNLRHQVLGGYEPFEDRYPLYERQVDEVAPV